MKTKKLKKANNSRFFFVENEHFESENNQEKNLQEVNICFIPVEKIQNETFATEMCEVSGFFLKATSIVEEKTSKSTKRSIF